MITPEVMLDSLFNGGKVVIFMKYNDTSMT